MCRLLWLFRLFSIGIEVLRFGKTDSLLFLSSIQFFTFFLSIRLIGFIRFIDIFRIISIFRLWETLRL